MMPPIAVFPEDTVTQLVLNVDDFEPQRYRRSTILRAAAFDVIEAGTGRQALVLARERRPSLVLLDVQLPDIDGFEVTRQLKADPLTAGTLVLQISATFLDPRTRVAALDNGADGYLAEPVESEELVAQVRSLLRLARAEAKAQRAEDALRESHTLLRAISDASTDAIFAKDLSGRLRFANPATLALIGKPLEQVLGKTDAEFLEDKAAAQRVMENDRDIMESSAAAVVEEVIPLPDGTERIWLSHKTPYRDAHGNVLGLLGISRDITGRKRNERALVEINARLEEADRRKDEFIAVLSHELRNPLAPIRYAIPLLQGEGLGEHAARALAVMDRQVTHLTRLVDDLLDVSRISTGAIELRRDHVTLGAVVTAAIEAAAPAVAAGHHTLQVEVAEEPVWLNADAARLSQIVTNLLDNSAKYTPHGGHISLAAGREEKLAVIRVRDDGIGIPAEAVNSIFDMFRRVSRTGDDQGGLGIGLALARRLVEMHGGTIEANSGGVGRGTEVVVRLPLADEVKRQGADATPPAPGGERRLNVLIVDDNADLVEMLALVVGQVGHVVRKATDGRSGVSAAKSFRPDVVLLDLGMPGMSGMEVARELKGDPVTANARLVALTGWGQAEDRRKTQEAGFDYHLTKPADPEAVQRLLADLAREP